MTSDDDRSDRDTAASAENPEWTDEELARAVPFATAFPKLAESLERGVEIVSVSDEAPLAVVLEADVAGYYRSYGADASMRLNADLRTIAGLSSPR